MNEWQSICLEMICAVLTASVFVAQCVAQEAAAAARARNAASDKRR